MSVFLAVVSMGMTLLADPAAFKPDLPGWFEMNRVQAHNEHPIDIAASAGPQIHAAIRAVGATGLTRIVLNRDEGAWWPSKVGEVHELTEGRDLARELIDDVHQRGMKCIGYFRYMSDMHIQTTHPSWVCRDHAGNPVREPRARRAKYFVGVICANSPYRHYITTRLVELAERGIDMIYFDSWHMPSVCTCRFCGAAFEEQTGKPFPFATGTPGGLPAPNVGGIRDDFEAYPVGQPPGGNMTVQHTSEYLEVSAFVSRSLVSAFSDWRAAVTNVNPVIRFAVGSSLYPMFTGQPHMTDDFLAIADTAKTEFHKPFGGSLGPMSGVADFAAPTFDIQTALGWMWTRDSSGGRPPLMWIPFIRREREALYSSAAAYSYGCIASLHLKVYNRRTKGTVPAEELKGLFGSSFERGKLVSPWLAHTRPYPWAAIHISQAVRNRHLDDKQALWRGVYAPVLGVFEALKEAHLPVVTVTDRHLRKGLAADTKVLILPWPDTLTDEQETVVSRHEAKGVTVVRLPEARAWHLVDRKPGLKEKLLEHVRKAKSPPLVHVTGPDRMHAVVLRGMSGKRLIVTLMNSWGWYRSHRQHDPDVPTAIDNAREPDRITDCMISLDPALGKPTRVFDAVTGEELALAATEGPPRVAIPPFQINRCVVVEFR